MECAHVVQIALGAGALCIPVLVAKLCKKKLIFKRKP